MGAYASSMWGGYMQDRGWDQGGYIDQSNTGGYVSQQDGAFADQGGYINADMGTGTTDLEGNFTYTAPQ